MFFRKKNVSAPKIKNSSNASNNFNGANALSIYSERFSYDLNGNIVTAARNGNNTAALAMDNLTYHYWNQAGTGTYALGAGSPLAPADATNKLAYVNDGITTAGDLDSHYAIDIDNQTNADNYQYDGIGNLVKDKSEEIDKIEWTVYGKIRSIKRTYGSSKDELEFKYDAAGNRIVKIVKPRTGGTLQDQSKWKYTYYQRDASGQVMAVYNRVFVPVSGSNYQDNYQLTEQDVYGSARLGLYDNSIAGSVALPVSTFSASNGVTCRKPACWLPIEGACGRLRVFGVKVRTQC